MLLTNRFLFLLRSIRSKALRILAILLTFPLIILTSIIDAFFIVLYKPEKSFTSMNDKAKDGSYKCSFVKHMDFVKDTRYFSGASVLIVIISVLAVNTITISFIGQPQPVQAATYNITCPTIVTAGSYTSADDLIFEGSGTCTLSGQFNVKSVTVNSGVTLSHAAQDSDGVTITTVNDFTLNGDIDTSDKGCIYGAGYGNSGFGPDITNTCIDGGSGSSAGAAYTVTAGAGHGGVGGNASTGASGGSLYDSAINPVLQGAGSGGTAWGRGSSGGGLVKLVVGGNFIHNGTVDVSGEDAIDRGNPSGGGSGGSINIHAAGNLNGSGNFIANGGNGDDNGSKDSGGGAGGRISVTHNGGTMSYTNSNFSVTGGLGGASQYDADNGTVYVKDINTNTVNIFYGFTYDDTDYSATTWTIDSSATSQNCDPSIGNTATPSITATDLTIAGSLDCTNVTVDSFSLSATNLSILDNTNLSVLSNDQAVDGDVFMSAITSFSLGTGVDINITGTGSDLDLTIPNGDDQIWDDVSITLPAEGIFTLDDVIDITLDDSTAASEINANLEWSNLSELTIDSNASINASNIGCTYGAGYNDSGYGPDDNNNCVVDGYGSTVGVTYTAGPGAGHGSTGGDGTGGSGGSIYNDVINPVLFGAGSGGTAWGRGSYGGGLVKIGINGVFTHNGNIYASGEAAVNRGNPSGGGSGGSINISSTGNLNGSGNFIANGGNGDDNGSKDSGGGAGGRISVTHNGGTMSYTNSNFSVTGGLGGASQYDADNGTVYVKNISTNTVNVFHGFTYDDTDHTAANWIIDSSASNQYCDPSIGASATPSITATNNLVYDGSFNCSKDIASFALSASTSFSMATGASLELSGTTGDLDFSLPNDQIWDDVVIKIPQKEFFTIDDSISITLDDSTGATEIYSNVDWSSLVNLTIDASSFVNATGKGCQGVTGGVSGYADTGSYTCTQGATGAGLGGNYCGAGGGGHGDSGGSGSCQAVGGSYGDPANPTTFGASGGGTNSGSYSGAGGGVILLDISDTLLLNGTLSVDGEQGPQFSSNRAFGAGAGGSINLSTGIFDGDSGIITADGGQGGGLENGSTHDGGGGSGGIVFISYATDDSSYLSTLDKTNVTIGGNAWDSATDGEDGDFSALSTLPYTPSISTPISGTYNNNKNPTITSSTYGCDTADVHTSTDWKITTDSNGNNIVWSKDDDAVNLESITVNTSNGTFSGDLTGETELADYTTYYIFVRYDNSKGSSEWSATNYGFKIEYTGSSKTFNWHYNNDYSYTFDPLIIEENSGGNSYAQLIDLGGGSYFTTGLNGNTKRKEITLTNTEAEETNHQVQLNINYDSDMQADFDDIRFTESDGSTGIDYWRESYIDSTSAVFWIEVPTLAALGDTTIYMYYGNASLSTTSNATDTFIRQIDNLEGYWDYSISTSYPGSGTTWFDISGNNRDMNASGDPSWGSSDGWNFDGNDRFDGPSSAVFPQGSNPRTVVTTAKPTALSGYKHVFHYGHTSTYQSFGIASYGTNINDHTWASGCSKASWTNNVESNIAITGSGSTHEIFKDGSSLGTCNSTINTGSNYASQIGSRISPSEYWAGYIKNVQIYSAVLTNDEISDLHDHRSYASEDYPGKMLVRNVINSEPSVVIGSEVSTGDYNDIAIVANSGFAYEELYSIEETLGAGNQGEIFYIFSVDNGANWKYLNGATIDSVTQISLHNNTINELNSYFPKIKEELGTGTLLIKAFLLSNGVQPVQLDRLAINYYANDTPTAPTVLYSNNTDAQAGLNNPDNLTDITPVFSAIYNDPDSGDIANQYSLEVDTQADFLGTDMWNPTNQAITNITESNRSTDIEYAGDPLTCGATYHWRIKFKDDDGEESPWSSGATFEINCTPTTLDDSGSTDEDVDKLIDLSHTDGDDATVTYSIDDDVDKGTLSVVDANLGTFTYDPNDNFNGVDTFTYLVNDGTEDSNTSTYTITVDPINDDPVFSGPITVTAWDEDTSKSNDFDLDDYFSDVDSGDSCTYSIIDDPAPNITVSIDGDNKVSFTSIANYNGIETIAFRCTDTGSATADTNSISLTVNAVNDVPTANAGTDQNVTEDDTVNLDGTGSADVDTGDTLTYSWTETSDPADACSLNDPTSSTPTVTLSNKDSNYNCTMQLVVNDGILDSVADTMTIYTTADNDEPELNLPYASTTVDEGSTISVSLTASDVDSSSLTLAAPTNPTTGKLTDNGNNTADFEWETDYDDAGEYTVVLSANDGINTTTSNLGITVNDVAQEEDNPEPDETEPEEATEEEITRIIGSGNGQGIVTLFNNDNQEICSINAFSKGGALGRLIRIKNKPYISVVKNKPGSTIHLYKPIYADECELIEKKRLSPRLHPRRMATANFINKPKTEEVAVSARRGGGVHIKIYRYNITKDQWKLIKRKHFREVPSRYTIQAIDDNTIIVKRKSTGKKLYTWKIN